jgi:hypothetical protein
MNVLKLSVCNQARTSHKEHKGHIDGRRGQVSELCVLCVLCGYSLLIICLPAPKAEMREALTRALAELGRDALVSAQVRLTRRFQDALPC